MNEHRHSTVVPGCYRCELSKDEYLHNLEDQVKDMDAEIEALEAEIERLRADIHALTHRPAPTYYGYK